MPNTANFRATKSTSLLGTTEIIYEYDWTAGSEKEAKAAEAKCQALQAKAEAIFEPAQQPAQQPAEKPPKQNGEK